MIKAILEFFLSFFKPKKQIQKEDRIKDLKQELKEIEDEENSPSDNVDYLNDAD